VHPGSSPAPNVDVTRRARDLGDGACQFQSPLWKTNSFLAVTDYEALVCDPALTPAEIEEIRVEAGRRARGPVHVLITHGDFDHVCGIPHFPEAEVIAGADAARKIETGAAADDLRDAGPEWGVSWAADALRVDRVVAAEGEFACGAFRVATIDAPSHGREGLAYILLDPGILLAGDHLSSITYPLLAGPVERAVHAHERLLEALGEFDIRWVVPGHGPALSREEAKEIGEEDLAYLERLAAAARDARTSGESPGYALLRVYAVEPPRPTSDDFEIYDIRAGNARLVLEELANPASTPDR
jgi:hydroxyacylglutathione hydrolase